MVYGVGYDNIADCQLVKAMNWRSSGFEIEECIKKLMDDNIVREYAEKAVACCKRHHDKNDMQERIYSILRTVAEQK